MKKANLKKIYFFISVFYLAHKALRSLFLIIFSLLKKWMIRWNLSVCVYKQLRYHLFLLLFQNYAGNVM